MKVHLAAELAQSLLSGRACPFFLGRLLLRPPPPPAWRRHAARAGRRGPRQETISKDPGSDRFFTSRRRSLQVTADLCKRYGASLTLVYVYVPVSYSVPDGYTVYTPTGAQLGSMFEDLRRGLQTLKAKAEAAGAGRVETRLMEGPIASELCDLAATEGFDLIVMGTHGRTGFLRVVLGSVAEKVVRAAACAVLTAEATRAVRRAHLVRRVARGDASAAGGCSAARGAAGHLPVWPARARGSRRAV